MFSLVEAIQEKLSFDYCTDTELELLIGGTKDRRYGLVKRALASKKLLRVCRGFYVLGKKYRRRSLDLYALAGQIYGPSYISFESALSYHAWIPEAVYTVTSATTKRAKTIETPFGAFSYARVPRRNAMQGVERIEKNQSIFFVASPWRAILDYVYVNNPGWRSREALVESLRIDEEKLVTPPWQELAGLEAVFASRRVSQFLKRIK